MFATVNHHFELLIVTVATGTKQSGRTSLPSKIQYDNQFQECFRWAQRYSKRFLNLVCVTGQKVETGKILCLTEMMLDTFDSFNTNDQMIMKCACVLGRQFSRAMMNRLLPTSGRDQQKYIEGFQRLMENRVFRCATAAKGKRGSDGNPGQLAPIECACNITGNIFGKNCSCKFTPAIL